MAVDFSPLLNSPNPIAAFQQGMQQGRQQRAERQADEAFKAYQSNPDDLGAINALLMADPDRGKQALQIRQLQRDESLRNALMGAYDPNTGSLDPAKAKQAYIGAGDVQGAMNIDKTAREAQKAQLEQGLRQVEAIGQLVGSVTDQTTYTAAVERAKALGIDVGEVPAQYDPAYVAGLQKQAVDAKGQIELAAKERGFALDVAKFEETQRSNQVRESISAGQLDVSRANLGIAQGNLAIRAQELARSGQGILKPADARKFGVSLRKEFNQLPNVKAFNDVRASFQSIQQIAKNPSAANDLAMIFSYMKMLDPGSVVREGEFANAQSAAGVPDRVRNTYNKLVSGERLTQKQRNEFVASAGTVYKARREEHNRIAREYQGYARDVGVDPNIVAKEFKPTGKTASGGSVARIKSDADYAKLPSGAIFIAPDGSRRRKP